MLNVKWKWALLRDRNTCLSSGSNHEIIVNQGANGNLILAKVPSFVLGPPFDGLNPIFGRPWNIIFWCYVRCHVDFKSINFFGPHDYCKVNLDHLQLVDQSHDLYIMGQGPSTSSLKWPLLQVKWWFTKASSFFGSLMTQKRLDLLQRKKNRLNISTIGRSLASNSQLSFTQHNFLMFNILCWVNNSPWNLG